MGNTFELISPLSAEECAARLQSMIDLESLDVSRLRLGQLPGGAKPFIGEASAAGFTIRRRTLGRNSFQTYAVGQFVPSTSGTVISGRLGPHPGFRWGYAAYGCFLVFIGLPVGLHLLYQIGTGEWHWTQWQDLADHADLGVLVVCFFVPLLFAVGRSTAADESTALHVFLKQALEASDTSAR